MRKHLHIVTRVREFESAPYGCSGACFLGETPVESKRRIQTLGAPLLTSIASFEDAIGIEIFLVREPRYVKGVSRGCRN
jgi:hypothetical protein